MASNVRTRIAQLLSSHRRRVIYVVILSFVAAFVAYEVVLHLSQRGITMVREKRVLDCPFDGIAAHTHDASCYDEEGNLVCLLEERELHIHDDSCYTEEQVLVCGQEEREGHTHTEECYDEEGNLTCELEESEGHHHTDECYEVERTLTCGQEEVTETHVHGPGCFKTVLVDDGETEIDLTSSAASGEQTLIQDLMEKDAQGNDQLVMSVMVKAPVGTLPSGANVEVTLLGADQVQEDAEELLRRELGDDVVVKNMASARLALVDSQGEAITPVGSVQVKVWADFVNDAEDLVVVRLVDEGDAGQLQPELVRDAWLVNWDEHDQMVGNEDSLQFWMDRPTMSFAIVELDASSVSGELVAQQTEQQADQQPTDSQLVEVTLDFDPDSDPDSDSDATGTTETSVAYPAQEFEGRAGNVLVAVKAPEGAFPAGTTMRVEVVDTGDVKDAVTSAVSGMVETVAAVDITFYDANGAEVQPLVPIQVTMTNDDALDAGQPIVLHLDDEGEASVVEQTPIMNSYNEVNFDTGSFSVYVMARK